MKLRNHALVGVVKFALLSPSLLSPTLIGQSSDYNCDFIPLKARSVEI
jgi:hypothetical protein